MKLKQDGTQVTVMLYEDKSKKEMLEEYLMQQIILRERKGFLLEHSETDPEQIRGL